MRIAEQVVEYLQNGVAINSVNMPAMSPDQYKSAGPYIDLAERLGNFAAHLVDGNPKAVRLTYYGAVTDLNTTLLRNAGLAGVLNRSTASRANVVNAMQLASDRGWNVAAVHDRRSAHLDTIRIEVETDSGVTTVEGALVLGKPRLIHVDGIYCEAPLTGSLVFLKNLDLPGVVGHIGSVLGSRQINIANFSFGRNESENPVIAIAVVTTDSPVPPDVLEQLKLNPAVQSARFVNIQL